MISDFYGNTNSPDEEERLKVQYSKALSILELVEAAGRLGFTAWAARVKVDDLRQHASFPCILHWNRNHYVVLYKVDADLFHIVDPVCGLLQLHKPAFKQWWIGVREDSGIMITVSRR